MTGGGDSGGDAGAVATGEGVDPAAAAAVVSSSVVKVSLSFPNAKSSFSAVTSTKTSKSRIENMLCEESVHADLIFFFLPSRQLGH